MYSNFHYNKNLKLYARKLRNASTKGEQIVWREILQKRQMKGYRFLRQRAIMNFIADFFCKELKLIIEVDGATHQNKVDLDKERDKLLKAEGYYVLRIHDDEVFDNLEGVVWTIENAIRKIKGVSGL